VHVSGTHLNWEGEWGIRCYFWKDSCFCSLWKFRFVILISKFYLSTFSPSQTEIDDGNDWGIKYGQIFKGTKIRNTKFSEDNKYL